MSKTGAECLVKIRDPLRATASDYIDFLFPDFFELHGDRLFADDSAICAGVATFAGRAVTVIAQMKGKNLAENRRTNFAMPHPEGYRKALRLAKQAEKFHRPVICLIDTPGAFCGIGAEERGQSEAIATNLAEFMALKTPIISIVLGEAGSGGALALGVCDRLAMLEYAIYSVISPRGCASILWKDPKRELEAADTLKITAKNLKDYGICDIILEEDDTNEEKRFQTAVLGIETYLKQTLPELISEDTETLLEKRYEKYRNIGVFHVE